MFISFIICGLSSNCTTAIEKIDCKPKKIAVAGLGYVGLSNAILLAQNNEVYAIDIMEEKVNLVNNKISPFVDADISDYLKNKKLNLTATTNEQLAYKDAEFVVIATPTDYNVEKNFFDTSSVETVIKRALTLNPNTTIVIKSTIPIGYTKMICEKYPDKKIIFSPEFLREGKALYDTLYPSRIIVGGNFTKKEILNDAKTFANLLKYGAINQSSPVLLTGSTEAEAIKLFSNAYLALRVAYFNELDTYCEIKNLNTKQIIDGVGADPRIGSHYNNPSFGYGGYCFPKDTKQLLANFKGVPNNVVKAIVDSNETRKTFIADRVLNKISEDVDKEGDMKSVQKTNSLPVIDAQKNISKNPDTHTKIIGIHKLAMKSGSDNFRQSAILDVIKKLKSNGANVIIYEPTVNSKEFMGCPVVNNLEDFKKLSNIIVSNRYDTQLNDVLEKVYSRDVFCKDW